MFWRDRRAFLLRVRRRLILWAICGSKVRTRWGKTARYPRGIITCRTRNHFFDTLGIKSNAKIRDYNGVKSFGYFARIEVNIAGLPEGEFRYRLYPGKERPMAARDQNWRIRIRVYAVVPTGAHGGRLNQTGPYTVEQGGNG